MVLLFPIAALTLVQEPVNYHTRIEELIRFGESIYETNKAKPIKHWVKRIQNRHLENSFDEWHTFQFKDFRAGVLRSKSEQRDFLGTIVITNSSIKLPFGIQIGDSTAMIESLLGVGTKNHSNALMYSTTSPPDGEVLFFHFKLGKLARIEWVYPID